MCTNKPVISMCSQTSRRKEVGDWNLQKPTKDGREGQKLYLKGKKNFGHSRVSLARTHKSSPQSVHGGVLFDKLEHQRSVCVCVLYDMDCISCLMVRILNKAIHLKANSANIQNYNFSMYLPTIFVSAQSRTAVYMKSKNLL